jgi:hypothetical protein
VGENPRFWLVKRAKWEGLLIKTIVFRVKWDNILKGRKCKKANAIEPSLV